MTTQAKRKSFIIHKDSLHILKDMTNEQAGIFIKAIDFYQQNNRLPELDFGLKMAIIPFINQFERDEENYKKTCEARREAGSVGGKQKVANASKCKQKVAKVADNKNDNKNDIKNDIKNENKDNEEKYFYDKLPDFIDKKMWTDFIDFRISIATKLKPLTNKVKNLLIKKLSDFEKVGKGNANLALENSIVNSWQGVFEPKQNNFNNNKKPVGMPQPQYDDPDYYKNDGGWND